MTVDEARALLEKKLTDLPLSRSNAAPPDTWSRSILHVMACDGQHADAAEQVWSAAVAPALKGDAILFLTVTDGDDGFMY